MKLLLLSVLTITLLPAQTKPTATQLRTQSDQNTYVLVFQNGRAVLAVIGAGLTLDMSTSPPRLLATQVVTKETYNKLTRTTEGKWQLPTNCNNFVLYRNGLLQFGPEDYTITSNLIQFKNGANDNTDPSLPDDLVVAVCK